jgi:uncharacterized protein
MTPAQPSPDPPPQRRPFQLMVNPVGARCNLECRYCHYREKELVLYPGTGAARMDDARLETLVRDHIAAQPEGEEVVFIWQGGEPTLLGLDTFRRIVEWQRRHGARRRIQNSLQTNGTLVDDAWAEFLHEENFLVGISIDGPRHMHDAYRMDAGDRPTWDRVMAGLHALRRHRVDFGTTTVVHRRNCRHPREVYDFLVTAGARHLQFIPLVERRADNTELARGFRHADPGDKSRPPVAAVESEFAASAQSLPPGRYGQFLRTMFDHWSRRDVGRVFVEQFESALAAWCGEEPSACPNTRRCRRVFAVEHDGEMYGCDHYAYRDFSMGNVSRTPLGDIANGPAIEGFCGEKESLPDRCLACAVRFACNGDCPKHRFVRAGAGERPVSYLCGDYSRFFRHIDPVMREMAALLRAGRPASEIMKRPKNEPPSAFS